MPDGRSHIIAPSVLSADFVRLAEEIERLEEAGADWLHLDVMDGAFVPNITFGQPVVAAIAEVATLPLDVHLMIDRPERYVEGFCAAGADTLTVHVEASTHLHRTLQAIRDAKARAGVSLNPHTPPTAIEWVLDELDLVLVMSVNPGFGGQSFIEPSLRKIEQVRAMIDRRGLDVDIEVDGGVKVDNIRRVADAGANAFVSGSGILRTPDYAETISAMRRELTTSRAATT